MQIRTPGTWWVFRNVVGFHPIPLPPIPVFISVETHVIDGTPGTAVKKQGHRGNMSSVMRKPHVRPVLAAKSSGVPHLDLRKESDAGFPNIQAEITFCLWCLPALRMCFLQP